MSRHFGAWIRYGEPITADQIAFAIDHYQSAILQPWELDALAALKKARPDMTVLTYKCLSSTRSYEPGPYFTSGIGHREAEQYGEEFFGHRADGSRIEWNGYPGHWQMAVWRDEYHEKWVANVTRELDGSLWDGVLADNDVFDDYYGLRPPLENGLMLPDLRAGLGRLIDSAGAALNGIGKILVPNIAESRREPGRWARHAAWGGGFEEVWLAHTPHGGFDPETALRQMDCLTGPGITIARTATDGTDDHPHFRYGLALFWIFGTGRPGTSFAATGHDSYSGTPFIPELDWDLGSPDGPVRRRGHARWRRFTHGWAAANLNPRSAHTLRVPAGLFDALDNPAPGRLRLPPQHGVVLRKR